MNLQAIWTGDTTTHGGILAEGITSFCHSGKHFAVCIGHKFWCPKCQCWSSFVEGYAGFSIHGKARVLNGYMASCGARAIHQSGIQDWCEDDREYLSSAAIGNEIKVAKENQAKAGNFYHKFILNNDNPEPLDYIVFTENTLLDMGTASAKGQFSNTSSQIITDTSEKVVIAVKAPPLKI